VTWAADNVTRTTTYSFANGGANAVVDTVPGTNTYAYAGAVETVTTTYGNGVVVTNTASATSNTVSWASDNVTRTTTYSFADGRTNAVVDTVPGTAGTPTYSGNTQTIVTTFGNGQTSTATNTASSSAVTWAADNVTRTTTYTFANGGTNAVVATVPAVVSTPVLTAAVYPSDWTTSGSVTNPTVSPLTNTFGNDVVTTLENGSSSLPFNQSTLLSLSITDPSAVVRSSTTDYNLIWGTPDKSGPTYVSYFPNAQTVFTNPIYYMGIPITSTTSLSLGPTLKQPAPDVLSAWNQGWTGSGKNILMVDDYSNTSTCNIPSVSSCHGINTMMIANTTALGASLYALDFGDTSLAKDSNNINLTSSKAINVVNMSFGNPSDASSAVWVNYLKGVSTVSNLTLTGAVITKSAGNISADTYSGVGMNLVKALVDDSDTSTRLLIVGALDNDGSVSTKASIASYSNYAGATSAAQNRFILANGNTTYTVNVGINGFITAPAEGTSYAAPRVAGYASILMQKFPNLDAVKTSSIILDTARYDTLTCHPTCDPAIYGKGEASLSRALAPVGRLR
jgi:hypothetical protein